MTCPACDRGEINETRICNRCGVGVPVQQLAQDTVRRKPRRRPDQDNVGPYTDYVRTKEDQA